MDKSVAQKFMIVMSMLTAMFATVFVCGSIVSSSVSSDGYIQPVPKTQYVVTYSDTSIYETSDDPVSQSDTVKRDKAISAAPTASTAALSVEEDGVTVVEFVDDEDEDYTSETINVQEEDIDNQFLYMTTVTTKLPDANMRESSTTTTIRHTTTTTTRRTTKKTVAVTAARPYTTKASTTTSKKTTTKIKTTSTKANKTTTTQKTTESTVQTTTTVSTTPSTASSTKQTQTKATTTTAETQATTKRTTTASETQATTKRTTAAETQTTTKRTTAAETQTTTKRTTAEAPKTTTTQAPQIGGAVSINRRTTTEGTEANGQP